MSKVYLISWIITCYLFTTIPTVQAQVIPYKNSALPTEVRVRDLLQRMTPEEKFRQLFMVPGDLGTNPDLFRTGLFGFQVNTEPASGKAAEQILQYGTGTTAVQTAEKINSIQKFFVEKSRLGIPIIAFDEALHGLVRQGATVFPQSIALAATWDTVLMSNVAAEIARECRARGIRQVLSPVVNLATDARWGRVEETYGEDPVLAAGMGVAFVKSFEKLGIVSTPKHFAVNHGEGGRDSYPIDISERLLEESYLVPFKACIQQGGSRSIMTAYNSLNGRPASANHWLLNQKLKNEWGFTGFVISDANATGGANVLHFTASGYEDAGTQAVSNGQDGIFQTDIDHAKLYQAPFLDGRVKPAVLDSAVARVLRIKFNLGLFEDPYVDPELAGRMTYDGKLAKEAALKSAVLLKNEKAVLPLSPDVKSIALIGTDAIEARLGGYSGPGNNTINLLDGLKKVLNKSKLVQYAEGCGRTLVSRLTVDGAHLSSQVKGKRVNGLKGEYFNNITMEGPPVLTRNDPSINFQWTLSAPHPDVNYDFFSVRWTGTLLSPESGSYKLGIEGNHGYRLFLDKHLLIDTWDKPSYSATLANVILEKGKEYALRIEYKEPSGNSRFKLVWTVGVEDKSEEKISEAVALAMKSDYIIVAAGIEEGEGLDRSSLALPGKQEEMILRLAATGKPIVVVLFGGGAITMTRWLDKVDGVMDVWYPGEAGGEAIAELLSGKSSPSGKLPITFPLNEGQLPLTYNHKPTGRNDDYRDGSGKALFPFGYGLSYARFEYSRMIFSKKEISTKETVTVTCMLRNVGNYEGDEVVQLYIRDELASVVRPVKELKAFQRIHLKPGKEATVSFTITPDMLSLVNERMEREVEPGTFRIMIGSSSEDIRLRDILSVK